MSKNIKQKKDFDTAFGLKNGKVVHILEVPPEENSHFSFHRRKLPSCSINE